MPRKKGSRNKKKGIAPFEPNVDIEVIKENSDGLWVGKIIPIKATLKCLGRIYKAEGETIEEVLGKIKISGGAKAMSILTIEKDGLKKEKILNPLHTSHLFGNAGPTMKMISLKWIKQLFNL